MCSGAATTSRLGFTGKEDLGGGAYSGFTLESQITLSNGATGSSATGGAQSTTGTSEVFNRQANIVLGSNQAGELKLGRQATPLYGNIGQFDAFGVNSLGLTNYFVAASVLYGTNAITGQNGSTNVGNASSSYTDPNLFANGISYATPTFFGVKSTLFTSPGSGSTTTQNTGAIREATVNYSGSDQLAGLNAVVGYGTTDSTAGGAIAQSRSLIGANYTWNKFKFSASRVYIQFYNSTFGNGSNTIVGDNTLLNSIGVKYQVTAPIWVGVEYTTAADKNVTANKSSTLGLGAGYDLSKRTNVYALVGSVRNSGASTVTPIYGSSATGNAGISNLGYVVGLRHSF